MIVDYRTPLIGLLVIQHCKHPGHTVYVATQVHRWRETEVVYRCEQCFTFLVLGCHLIEALGDYEVDYTDTLDHTNNRHYHLQLE